MRKPDLSVAAPHVASFNKMALDLQTFKKIVVYIAEMKPLKCKQVSLYIQPCDQYTYFLPCCIHIGY